jgi:hypothetical protein
MASAIFFVNHEASNSCALVEFSLVKGKIKLVGLEFVSGKVIELASVRACREIARQVLHDPTLPSPTQPVG